MSIAFVNHGPTGPEKFAGKIKCKCGQIGSATWEASAQLSAKGSKAVLVSVSNGFYLRIRKNGLSKTEIACSVCEATASY